ncbi:hypothetical protein [Tolypothrix sp. VBCCA 56010]|uniref:hypothetical protein n=1 Tax=Tolypothrix sp. VBCCA 56010 TaxID=3137731 RepID=UPI003D7C7ED3
MNNQAISTKSVTGEWGIGHGALGMERIVFTHPLAFLNFFNSQCPITNAQCPMPNALCPMPNYQ